MTDGVADTTAAISENLAGFLTVLATKCAATTDAVPTLTGRPARDVATFVRANAAAFGAAEAPWWQTPVKLPEGEETKEYSLSGLQAALPWRLHFNFFSQGHAVRVS